MAKAAVPSNEAPAAQAPAQEPCRSIVVDVQDIAKIFEKAKSHVLDAMATGHVHPGVEVLVVPIGKPMSTFHVATLPVAYV